MNDSFDKGFPEGETEARAKQTLENDCTDSSEPCGDAVSAAGEYDIREKDTYTCGPMTFKEKLENFWYHYKWHSIAAIFVCVALFVVVFQLATVTKYDLNVMYAGGYRFSRTSENGEIPKYNTALESLARITEDYDDSGEIAIDLQDHYVLTAEEISALKAEGKGNSINESLIATDYKDLNLNIIAGDYHVVFISEALFADYDKQYEGGLFADLTPYLENGSEYSFALGNTRGIYLSSLPFSRLPVIAELPEDTVVCLRVRNGQNTEQFERAEDAIRRILAFD